MTDNILGKIQNALFYIGYTLAVALMALLIFGSFQPESSDWHTRPALVLFCVAIAVPMLVMIFMARRYDMITGERR